MIYQCLVCGESFKQADGEYRHGYLVCPICGCEDLIVVWDENNPATSFEDFGLEKELADLKAMREASRCR
jgi:predicted  nucleic acid-binding Zn-ribbon protein